MNQIILIAIIAVITAQLLKYPIYYLKHNEWNSKVIFSTGSMPSSHTALVTAVTFQTGILSGFDSVEFGICFVFAGMVIHDAVKVRGESGKQAQVINMLLEDVKTVGRVMDVKVGNEERNIILKELIGHTTSEVIVGFFMGLLVFGIYNLV